MDKNKANYSPLQVAEYLRKHPEFFKENSALLEALTPPEGKPWRQRRGYLQHHMLGRLQSGLQKLSEANMKAWCFPAATICPPCSQIHNAVLAIIRAPMSWSNCWKWWRLILPAVFNVDVVRLGIESEAADFYETRFGEHNPVSGVAFLEAGLIDAVLGKKKSALLMIENAEKQCPYGFDQIFFDCENIVESAVFAAHAPALLPAQCHARFRGAHQKPFPCRPGH